MIWIPHALGILLTLWKISQATKIAAKNTFPYFTLVDKASYADTPTKQYDR
jgi:Cleft lip and palate transmembrane protein 1 (CLPTM1)